LPSEKTERVSDEVRLKLLKLARRSISTFLEEGKRLRKGVDYEECAPEPRGAFVTLKTRDEGLRGCIGTIFPVGPLDETVVRMAVAAAVEDPRFPAVYLQELKTLKIEISALTVPEDVPDVELIETGRHGLIITLGSRKGLLLPQVAPEWGWNRMQFLAHTCEKAGLSPDAWKRPEIKIEWFEAEVWKEG